MQSRCSSDRHCNRALYPWCHYGCLAFSSTNWERRVDRLQLVRIPGTCSLISIHLPPSHALQLAGLANIASNYLISGKEATRHGTAHPSIVPYQVFPCKDGFLMIGAGNDKQVSVAYAFRSIASDKYSTSCFSSGCLARKSLNYRTCPPTRGSPPTSLVFLTDRTSSRSLRTS